MARTQTIAELRDRLISALDELDSDPTTVPVALAKVKVVGAIISTARLELDYAFHREGIRGIKFLEPDSNSPLEITPAEIPEHRNGGGGN